MEVKGSGGSGASTYRYALTDSGRDRARQYMEVSHYVGAAPVSLARYVAYMTALQAARGYMDKERLRNGFSHLIISDEVLEMVGPAVNAGKAVFLYGPPGKRQVGDRGGYGPVAWRRHAHPARHRRRRPHGDDVRPDRARVARGIRASRRSWSPRWRTIDAGSASAGRSSWWAAS
jgi:hypothetical protein